MSQQPTKTPIAKVAAHQRVEEFKAAIEAGSKQAENRFPEDMKSLTGNW